MIEVLQSLQARGATVTLTSDDKIRVEGPEDALDEGLRDLIRQERDGLVALLKNSRCQEWGLESAFFASAASAPVLAARELRTQRTQRTQARSPILDPRERNRPRLQDLALFPAGLPLDWHEGLERLAAMPPPSGFSDERWSTGVWWAHQIAAEDAAAPQGGGWTGLDLFGLHPIAPACRYDSMGLAFLLRPGDAIAFGASGDTSITRLNGTRQSMRQGRIGPEAVLAWALPQSGGR